MCRTSVPISCCHITGFPASSGRLYSLACVPPTPHWVQSFSCVEPLLLLLSHVTNQAGGFSAFKYLWLDWNNYTDNSAWSPISRPVPLVTSAKPLLPCRIIYLYVLGRALFSLLQSPWFFTPIILDSKITSTDSWSHWYLFNFKQYSFGFAG